MSVITSSFVIANRVADREADILQRNIANINSEDYSARIVNKETVVFKNGSFVRDTREMRKFDERMQLQFLNSTSIFEEMNTISTILSNAEDDFIGRHGSVDGIINLFEELQKSVMVFYEDPSDVNARTIFFRQLDVFVEKLNSIDNVIDGIGDHIDDLIKNSVDKFNTTLASVYDNNINYVRDYYVRNGQSSTYADLVDNALVKLNEITQLKVKPFREEEGVRIDLVNVRVLETMKREVLSYKNGEIFIGKNKTAVTEELQNNYGQLGGYLKLKNNILPSFKNHLEVLRESFVREMNALANNSYYKVSEISHGVFYETVDDSFGIEAISGNVLRVSVVNPETDEVHKDIDVDFTDLFYDVDGNVLGADALKKISVQDFILKIQDAAIDALIPGIAGFDGHAFKFEGPSINGIKNNIVLSGDLVINGKSVNEFFAVNNLILPSVDSVGYKVSTSAKEGLTFQEMNAFKKGEPSNFREKNIKILSDLKNILTTSMIEFGQVETEVQGLSLRPHRITFQEFINEVVLSEAEVISIYKNEAKSSEALFLTKKESYLHSKQVDVKTEQQRFEMVMQLKECLQKIYKMSNDVMKSLLEVM